MCLVFGVVYIRLFGVANESLFAGCFKFCLWGISRFWDFVLGLEVWGGMLCHDFWLKILGVGVGIIYFFG